MVTDPEERARHLALGAQESSEETALELDRAANGAVSRGAPDAAADLLELATALTPPGEREQGLARTLAAAECHFQSGNLARARALADQVLADPCGRSLRGEALRLLGELRYVEGSFAEAVPLFEEALQLPGPVHGLAELHLNLAFAHSILGDDVSAVKHADAALEAAIRVDDTALQAAALAMSATRNFRLGHPLDRDQIEAALALEDPDRRMLMPMRPTRLAGIAEYYSDNFARAAALYGDLRQRATDRGEDSHLPMLDADLAMAERTRGNLRRALEIADEGCEIAQMLGSQTALADMLCERSYVRAALGDETGARADAALAWSLQHR